MNDYEELAEQIIDAVYNTPPYHDDPAVHRSCLQSDIEEILNRSKCLDPDEEAIEKSHLYRNALLNLQDAEREINRLQEVINDLQADKEGVAA